MFLYTLLSLSFAEDDIFDLVDKKAKVSNHEYLNFDIHHQAHIEKNMFLDIMSMEKADDIKLFP